MVQFLLILERDKFFGVGGVDVSIPFFGILSSTVPENPTDEFPVKAFRAAGCHTLTDAAFITAISFPPSIETVPTREVEKDDLVGLLHSLLIAAPRVIAINDPVSMIAEKLFHFFLHPIPVTVYPTRLELKGVHVELGDGVVAG
jgi:hypothetical protein